MKIEEIWNLDKEELLQVSGIGDKTADEILDKKYNFQIIRRLKEKIDLQQK